MLKTGTARRKVRCQIAPVVVVVVTCLLGSLPLSLRAQEAPAPVPIKVRKIHFLIHPLTYAPECAHDYTNKEFYQAARAVENQVRRRHHEAIDRMGEDEALVIYPSLYPTERDPHPEELLDIEAMARRKLGRRLVICSYPTTAGEFVRLAKAQGLTYDAQTVESEGWGESFDGCVAKYCSRFSKELGLAKPIEQNFAMCVPDFIGLLKGKFVEKVSLPSKLRFYLFRTEDDRPMAVFFHAYFVPGDSPRSVDIPLEATKVEVYKYTYKASLTPVAMTTIPTPDGKGIRLPVSEDLADPSRRAYLVGKQVDLATFRAALRHAQLAE